MSVFKNLAPFQNVAANQTAVLPSIDQGMTYEKIILALGGTALTKAMLTAIRLWLGGKKIWEISGSDLDGINQYYGLTANAAYLELPFAFPKAKSLDEYLAGAIDTSQGFSNFSLEVDIGAATAPTLAAYAYVSAPIPKSKGYKNLMRTMVKTAYAPAAANEYTVPVPLGGAGGALINALHFYHANITQLQVVKDSFYLLQKGLNGPMQFEQNEVGRTTQAGLISWDPLAGKDFLSDTVPTLRGNNQQASWEIKVTTSAADNLRIYSDLMQSQATL